MYEIIAKSYRNVAIPIDSDKMKKRETGINNYIENSYDEKSIMNLVKLFFDKNCDQEFLDDFTEAFAEEDNIFADDQINELQVLAGIVLNQICELEKVDDLLKVTVYASSYVFMGRKPVLEDIYQNIQRIYEKITAQNRDNITFDYKGITQLPKDVTFSVEEGQTYEIDEKDINSLSSMTKKINDLCLFINKMYRESINKSKIIYENTELLWWLLTGYSNDEEKAYSELLDKQAALLVGKDLAEIVQYKPGPYLAKNLLYKALAENGHEKYLLREYIDVCNDSTIEKMLSGKEDKVNTPILYALWKKMETGEGNWIKAFERKFGHSELEYSGIEVAYQFYLECLILKW